MIVQGLGCLVPDCAADAHRLQHCVHQQHVDHAKDMLSTANCGADAQGVHVEDNEPDPDLTLYKAQIA